ncbi:MAG: Hsp20/alpha crystallin family protein [Phycisphaerae bacterium]
MRLSKLDPSKALRGLRNEFDILVDRFLERPLEALTGQPVPSLDVSESEGEITVKMDLPGVDEKDVDISIAGDLLTLRGQKKEEHEDVGKTFHIVERASGKFTRTVRLPVPVRVDMIRATYKKGVLEIVLPKKELTQAKKIEIKSEDVE